MIPALISFGKRFVLHHKNYIHVHVEEPTLPCRRKVPSVTPDDGAAPAFHDTVEKHYRVIFFEVLDLIISCITDRFNQPGYKTYGKVQALLLN